MRRFWPYLILLAITFLAYANVYQNEFLYDDEFLMIKNTLIRSWSSLFTIFTVNSTAGAGGTDSFFRPMQTLMYLIVYQICGLSTVGFHLLNVGLHAFNGCLIYRLGRRIGFREYASLVAALLWVAHPLHTEAVAYMSATADPLHTLLILAGLLTLLPDFSARRRGYAAIFFLLALLSKESAIVFPALAMVILFAVSAESERRRWSTYLKTWPYWMMALVYLIARKTILNFDHTFYFYKQANIYTEHPLYRIETALATLPAYFSLILYPHDLHFDRVFPVFTDFFVTPVLIGCALILAALGQILIGRGNKGVALTFALLWFAIAQSPHTGILVPVNALFLEHWMYLPSIGMVLGAVQTLATRNWFRGIFAKALTAVAVIAILAEAAATYAQNEVWATPISFYGNTLRFNPKGNGRVHNNLAMSYDAQGRYTEAVASYRAAIAVDDHYPQTHHNLGQTLIRLGRVPEAIQEFKRAIEIDPEFYHSYGVLSEIYRVQGDAEQSRIYQEKFLAIRAKYTPQ